MKTSGIIVLLFLLSHYGWTQTGPDRSYQPIKGASYTQSKNVYLLSLIEALPEVRRIIESDTVLSKVSSSKISELAATLEDCGRDGACYPRPMPFTPEEMETIAGRLEKLAQNHPELLDLVAGHLVPSGMYQQQASSDPVEYLANAWRLDASTINHIIGVYAMGKAPNYPNIDSLGMDLGKYSYKANIQGLNELTYAQYQKSELFFEPSLGYAMDALAMARMERAGDFEPMTKHENEAAFRQAKRTKWEVYEYPLILIPGAGTDNYLDSISSGGVLRCKLAALEFEKGRAPFIMVSGGYVHPYKVQKNEAVEMKRYLRKLGVPESAIIIEPHARHTTTNMRNAARIMFRYGFPMDRPSVTVTTPAQSHFIENMLERCMRELGYHTYTNGKRISNTILEFNPSIMSLQIDRDEPLDP
ncbi:YdcF family protein [Echinicola strongylocentroti]|uniref:YdcF family protein n=1 Tax=Echinicola strongylocentroti TaxID=1795355 RepID=A0A2Z4IG79_9BACT|nr:YdcF family protein [Echinicola strongylocentroti]AWW29697.1 YdcF family protein [Echinicola strongylocentroti]